MGCEAILLIPAFILLLIPSIEPYQHWDYFVFAQQWPASVCADSKITHKHTCVIPEDVNTWTVHGLWPTRRGSIGPQNCNMSEKFDPSKIEPLKEQMLRYWPNLYTDEPLNQFWEHEWVKHGTCAQSLPALSNEYQYFSQTLKLNRNLDLLGKLSEYGIKPTNNKLYQYVDFINAVKNIYGSKPLLQCSYDRSTKTQYLMQVEICVSKQFQVIECTHTGLQHKRNLRGATPCWSTEQLAYPTIEHVHLKPSIKIVGDTYKINNQL